MEGFPALVLGSSYPEVARQIQSTRMERSPSPECDWTNGDAKVDGEGLVPGQHHRRYGEGPNKDASRTGDLRSWLRDPDENVCRYDLPLCPRCLNEDLMDRTGVRETKLP